MKRCTFCGSPAHSTPQCPWRSSLLSATLMTMVVAPTAAQERSLLEPALIAAGTLALIRTPYINNKCLSDPCNTLSHVVLGAGIGWYVGTRYGRGEALITGLVVGVGKELLDKRFDKKDALATIIGTVASVHYVFD